MNDIDAVDIVVVEDDLVSRRLLEHILQQRGYRVLSVADGVAGLDCSRKHRPSLIISDWVMPNMDGMEFLHYVRSDPDLFDVYFIMLTAKQGIDLAVDALENGADDILNKPIDHKDLVARVHTGLRVVNLQKELKAANARLEILALKDELTGLYNRRAFFENAEREFARCRRYNETLSFFMIDVDHFKSINDRYGHLFGDEVLKTIAECLLVNHRRSDIVGRYGGEEFCVLLPNTLLENATIKAENLRTFMHQLPFKTQEKEAVHITISIGIGSLRPDHQSIDQIVREADSALYTAKRTGRNRCVQAGEPSSQIP